MSDDEEEKQYDIGADVWERAGAVGFELFHHNRAAVYRASNLFDFVSFVLVFIALLSIVPDANLTKSASWMKGTVKEGTWEFPDLNLALMNGVNGTTTKEVKSVRFGLKMVVFLDKNDEVVRSGEWSALVVGSKKGEYRCGPECERCAGAEESVRDLVIASVVMLSCTMLFSEKRKSVETDSHIFKFVCSTLAGLAVLFAMVAMVLFKDCADKPPVDGSTFMYVEDASVLKVELPGPGDVKLHYIWGTGYLGVLLNCLFSCLSLFIHLATPSPQCFDDSQYVEMELQGLPPLPEEQDELAAGQVAL